MIKVSQLFLYGALGVLVSWIALYYRYNDDSKITAQQYELPPRPKLEGPMAVNNDKLKNVEYILKGKIDGPESLLVEGDSIYTGLYDGRVVHIKGDKIVKEVRFTKQTKCGSYETEPICGRPLGIRRLNKKELLIADAYLGIFAVDMQAGTFRHIIKSNIPVEGILMRFINDVEVLNEDEFVFTDSSSQWDRRHFFHIILEHEATGRILKHKISTGETTVVLDNLFFPNGIQGRFFEYCHFGPEPFLLREIYVPPVLHPDGKSILFAELIEARINRYNLETKEVTPFAMNLPGFPDNIRPGAGSTLWVGLGGVRHADATSMMDAGGAFPLIRQLLIDFIPDEWWVKYSHMVKPKHAMVLQLNADGEIVQTLHDVNGVHIQDASQVSQYGDYLYFGSFHSKYIARLHLEK